MNSRNDQYESQSDGVMSNPSCFRELSIAFPAQEDTLPTLSEAFGKAPACETVEAYVDGMAAAKTQADSCGNWRICFPPVTVEGDHRLCISAGGLARCITVLVGNDEKSVPPPLIQYPAGVIGEGAPLIRGTARPGASVEICVDGELCETAPVEENGAWQWQYPENLADGSHIVTAAAILPDGQRSRLSYQVFQYDVRTGFSVTLDRAETGDSFRTIRLELSAYSQVSPITLYYLLLPPGSATPTAEEIINYTGPGLEDGNAAAGRMTLEPGGLRVLSLTGRENAPLGAAGLIDGYRYDIYLLAEAGEWRSSVLHEANVLAMPFGGGKGTEANPYQISQLDSAELLKYPDLLAERNPLGVDDSARMLRNIDRMRILADETRGIHGIRNSMYLVYQLTTLIDLSGYAAAAGGTGWPTLGYTGEERNPAAFSGILQGKGAATPIRGLTINREISREYDGLFAAGYQARFLDIQMEQSEIRVADHDPESGKHVRIALLAARMEEGFVRGITISGANIDFQSAYQYMNGNIGAICAESQNQESARELTGEEIHITVGGQSEYVYAGGLFSTVNTDDGRQGIVIENVMVNHVSLDGDGGVAHTLSNPRLLSDITVQNASVNGRRQTGSVIGLLSIREPGSSISRVRCEDCTLTAAHENILGGLFGVIGFLYPAEISECTAAGCTLTGSSTTGGLIGSISSRSGYVFRDCQVSGGRIQNAAKNTGGFVGSIVVGWNRTDDETADEEIPEGTFIFSRCGVEMTELISGGNYAGGFVGSVGNTKNIQIPSFEDCVSRGSVSSVGGSVGGFAGDCTSGTFTRCHAAGSVSGGGSVGGFIGFGAGISQTANTIQLIRCSAAGDISLTEGNSQENLGGFAGRLLRATIRECFATGNINADARYSGAFAGLLSTSVVIENSYATGNVITGERRSGGFAGGASGTTAIEHCYSRGILNGQSYSGGLCGEFTGQSLSKCLVLSPEISGTSPMGRVVGNSSTPPAGLADNYSTTLRVLENGAQKTIIDDPDGVDGGTITADQITAVMRNTGWPEDIWDYSSVTESSGPMLLNNRIQA